MNISQKRNMAQNRKGRLMKKKIALVLSVLMSALMLAACGTDPTTVDYNGMSYSDLERQTVVDAYYVSTLADYYGADFEFTDDVISQYEAYGISSSIFDAVPTWGEIEEEFGDNTQFSTDDFNPDTFDTSSFKVEKAGETLTTDLTLKFGDKDVDFQLVYDYYSMDVTGVTVTPIYSLGEKMSKAGLNTLISMSIVFVVLILISLIISCFKIFPYLENKKAEKKKAENATAKAADAPAVSEPEVEENLTDDTELVAVIAAAIAASEGTSTSGFVVRSINRR